MIVAHEDWPPDAGAMVTTAELCHRLGLSIVTFRRIKAQLISDGMPNFYKGTYRYLRYAIDDWLDMLAAEALNNAEAGIPASPEQDAEKPTTSSQADNLVFLGAERYRRKARQDAA